MHMYILFAFFHIKVLSYIWEYVNLQTYIMTKLSSLSPSSMWSRFTHMLAETHMWTEQKQLVGKYFWFPASSLCALCPSPSIQTVLGCRECRPSGSAEINIQLRYERGFPNHDWHIYIKRRVGGTRGQEVDVKCQRTVSSFQWHTSYAKRNITVITGANWLKIDIHATRMDAKCDICTNEIRNRCLHVHHIFHKYTEVISISTYLAQTHFVITEVISSPTRKCSKKVSTVTKQALYGFAA